MSKRKKYLFCLAAGAVFSAVYVLLALYTVRSFGGILRVVGGSLHADVQTFVPIFSQLNDACVFPPVWLPLAVGALLALWLFRIRHSRVWAKAVFAVTCVLIALVTYLCTVVLSFANGVLFLDIILSLIQNAGGLGL